MFNVNTIRQLCRQAALIVPALAMLLGAANAWSQTQVKKTIAVHTPTTLSIIKNNTATENVNDSDMDFVDIAFGSGPDSLFAASGAELFRYPGAMEPAVLIRDFSKVPHRMRSILTIAFDPITEQIYVFAETKGKPN